MIWELNAICRTCGPLAHTPYWHIKKSVGLHINGTGHTVDLWHLVTGKKTTQRPKKGQAPLPTR